MSPLRFNAGVGCYVVTFKEHGFTATLLIQRELTIRALTHSFLGVPLKIFVWIFSSFDNNFGTENNFTKDFKERSL